MQKIRKILRAISEKTALPTNQPTNQPTTQPIITNNNDLIGPRWRRPKKQKSTNSLSKTRHLRSFKWYQCQYFSQSQSDFWVLYIEAQLG